MRGLDQLWPLLDATTTFVGYLVEIGGFSAARLCSWGSVEWNGELWTEGVIANIAPSESAPYAHGGTIELSDPDNAFLVSLLRTSIVGAPLRIWYAPSFDLDEVEPVLIVDAFADMAQTNPTKNTVTITIVPDDGEHLMSPRERVTPDDYPDLLAPGSVIKFGNGQITLMGSRV